MALKEWATIVGDGNLSLADKERLLMAFHAKHNDKIHTHLLAHGSLFGCALKHRNIKKIATQGWLMLAVVPVHSRNAAIEVIRSAARNFA